MSEPNLTSFTFESVMDVYKKAVNEHVAICTQMKILEEQDRLVLEKIHTLGNELYTRGIE